MRKLFFVLFLISNAIMLRSQSDVLTFVEQMPSFPGGEKAMNDYIKKNIQYPKMEKEYGIGGIVYIAFVVHKDGTISDIKCLRGIKSGPALQKEAIRVISTMPKWTPGMQSGKTVNVEYQMPIKFTPGKKVNDDEMQAISAAHYKKGLELASKGQYQLAINEFDYCLFYMAGDVNTLYQRGMAFHNLKKGKEACDDWNKIQFQGDNKADELLIKFCK